MEITPPPLIVAFVRAFIPPDDREHVLGDLEERLRSRSSARPALRYLFDAMQTIPLVVWSRMRRVIAHPLFIMQALMLFSGFVAAALGTRVIDGFTFLVTEEGLLRISTPILVALFALLLGDTYGAPSHRLPWNHLKSVGLALGAAWAADLLARTLPFPWSLPRPIMVRGLVFGFLSVTWARFVFAFRGIEQQLDVQVLKTLGGLRAHAQRLEDGIRRRNLFAYMISLVLIVGFVRIATLALNLIQGVGAGLVVAAAIYLAHQVSQYRPAALPLDADYDASLQLYRDELTRQRDFHRGSAFWVRLAVLLAGPLLIALGLLSRTPKAYARSAYRWWCSSRWRF